MPQWVRVLVSLAQFSVTNIGGKHRFVFFFEESVSEIYHRIIFRKSGAYPSSQQSKASQWIKLAWMLIKALSHGV